MSLNKLTEVQLYLQYLIQENSTNLNRTPIFHWYGRGFMTNMKLGQLIVIPLK
jgi:hypothetical protein